MHRCCCCCRGGGATAPRRAAAATGRAATAGRMAVLLGPARTVFMDAAIVRLRTRWGLDWQGLWGES